MNPVHTGTSMSGEMFPEQHGRSGVEEEAMVSVYNKAHNFDACKREQLECFVINKYLLIVRIVL